MSTKKDSSQDRPIITTHKEGINISTNRDGSTHETKWYDSGQGASSRSSQDVSKDGGTKEAHTTVQKK